MHQVVTDEKRLKLAKISICMRKKVRNYVRVHHHRIHIEFYFIVIKVIHQYEPMDWACVLSVDKNAKTVVLVRFRQRIIPGNNRHYRYFFLGCFVTNILPGGPADVQGNIEVGDQILEFNGNSLIDSTYEEVRILQDHCGDIVQLVVQHNNVRLQINGGQTLSSIEVSRHFETVPRLSSSLTRKRRNLPPLPPSLSSSFPKQPKRQLYETVETLEVPNVKELKPILINRGRLLGKIFSSA